MRQSVDRALRLLLLFEEANQEYRVGELAAMLGVDKSTISRLAATLAERGFLERAPGSEAFRLGPELGRLGMLATSSTHNLIELARGPMERLAEETSETVNLAILEGAKAVNIAQVDGPHLVGVGDWTGWKTEPHTTANGKVLLAFAEEASEILQREDPLEAFTERTITSADELRTELGRIRSRGWASTLGELEEGFNGVAAPVFDASGRCLAALSVSGPVYRMPPDRLPEVAALCKEAAEDRRTPRKSSRRMPGFRQSPPFQIVRIMPPPNGLERDRAPLSARLGVPHGVAVAGVLTEVMLFNLPVSVEKIALAAWSLGVAEGSASDETNTRAAIVAAENNVAGALGEDVLSGVTPTRKMLDTIIEDALADPVINNTPRMPSVEQVKSTLSRTVGSTGTA